MTYEDRIHIATPEGVDLELTLAGLGSRVGGAVIDGAIKSLTLLILGILLAVVGTFSSGALGAVGFGVLIVFAFAFDFGYDVAFEVLGGGKTLGKRALGTRVMLQSGAAVDLRSSAVRNLLRLVDGQLTGYLCGTLMILLTSKNQRLGDLAAGTVVVRDRGVAPPPTNVRYDYTDDELSAWDVGAVDRNVVTMLRGFLTRRDTLDPVVRARLAHDLYTRVRPMVGGVSEQMSPEAFIEEVVRIKSRSQ